MGVNSDCASGHLVLYILCAQAFLKQGDLYAARKYFDVASFLFPMALPCMDPMIWTIDAEAFYERYRAIVAASDALARKGGDQSTLAQEDLMALAWRPAQMRTPMGLPLR